MAMRAGRLGTWRGDLESGAMDWDGPLAELFGLEAGAFEASYADYLRRIHPKDRAVVELGLRSVLESPTSTYRAEHRIILPDGAIRWVEVTVAHSREDGCGPAELVGVVADITTRRALDEQRLASLSAQESAVGLAGTAQRRLSMLSRASTLLDETLDLQVVMQRVADLAITEIADWCFVDAGPGGGGETVAFAHRDPGAAALATKLLDRYPTPATRLAREQVMSTLEPILTNGFGQGALAEAVDDEEHRRLVKEVHATCYLMVPMIAAARAVGIMVLLSSESKTLGPEDVEVVMELGRRGGAAIAKARMYAELAETARVLQANLLPPSLPDVPGLTLSAHYSSGTRGLDIGGDYYDVFTTGAGRWWMVLGDVSGKGIAAATLTAKVRHALRAIASGNDNPSRVMRLLNDVLLEDNLGDKFTTLVLVTFVEPGAPGGSLAADPALRLRIVSGGHPPALLRHADGRVEEVRTTGRLVGILPDHNAATVTLYLSPGDCLLLYTDGATEARDAVGHELGVSTLSTVLAEVDPAPPQQVAARVHDALLKHAPLGLTDDLALLALVR